eukprot:4285151-Pleurochrysis_carterae.AAC.1
MADVLFACVGDQQGNEAQVVMRSWYTSDAPKCGICAWLQKTRALCGSHSCFSFSSFCICCCAWRSCASKAALDDAIALHPSASARVPP